MNKTILLIFFAIVGFVSVEAQTPVPQRTPTPAEEAQRLAREREKTNRGFENLQQISVGGRPMSLHREIINENIQALYRKPNGRELKLLAPNPLDAQNFAQFLQQPNTGLTKLEQDFGCAENTKILVATENCLNYSMPGAGSSYSFRVKNYRIRRLADITFYNDSFQATGVLLHGFFVDVGDVPLETISLETKGLKFLTDFSPETDYEAAKKTGDQLSKGIEKDGFLYRRELSAREKTTYVLRSIAYRGTFYRAERTIPYNELDFDKRPDVIVAFRLVRRDTDGSVTILWKELARKESPKVKRKNNADEKKSAGSKK